MALGRAWQNAETWGAQELTEPPLLPKGMTPYEKGLLLAKPMEENDFKRYALKLYAEHGMVTTACRAVGITSQTFYHWCQDDEAFGAAYKELKDAVTEALEMEARRRASVGVDEPVFHRGEVVGHVKKYSDQLLIFLLKAMKPEVYRDRQEVTVTQTIKAYAGFAPEDV